MKKILLALGVVLAATTMTVQAAPQDQKTERHARTKRSPEERVARQTAKMQEKLNLSADQHARLLAVNKEVMIRRQQLANQGNGRDKAAMKEIAKYRKQQYASILTPTQMEQWKAFRAEQKAKHKAKKRNGADAPNMNRPAQSSDMGAAPRQ